MQLRNLPSQFLGMIMSVPLLPAVKFNTAEQCIKQREANLLNQRPTKIREFLRYLKKTWFKKAIIVSVFDSEIRANNCVESGNKYLRLKIGVHPNLWFFLSKF